MNTMNIFSETDKKQEMSFAESESYKKLRANILFSGANLKVLAITCAFTISSDHFLKTSLNICVNII